MVRVILHGEIANCYEFLDPNNDFVNNITKNDDMALMVF